MWWRLPHRDEEKLQDQHERAHRKISYIFLPIVIYLSCRDERQS